MNLEGIALGILANELAEKLVNGRIYKIFIPSKSSLLILVKTAKETVPLFANFGNAGPAIYIPTRVPDRPDNPPAFCMLLRKHLEEGRITAFFQQDADRVLVMNVDLIGANKQIVTKQLVFELTGKNSNIIFLQDGLITDSLRHIGKAQSAVRQILPGLPYCPPPRKNGKSFLAVSAVSLLEDALGETDQPLATTILQLTTDIGKRTLAEIFTRSDIDRNAMGLTLLEKQRMTTVLENLQQEIRAHLAENNLPVYALINNRNIMKDILPFRPRQLDEMEAREYPSIIAALDAAAGLVPLELPDKDILAKLLTTRLSHTRRKLAALAKDEENARNAEQMRIIADTLMANIYQLSKGSATCELASIYDGELLKISLNPALSPTDNARNYYKKYNKFKRAQEVVAEQKRATAELLSYLESLEISLATAVNKGEIAEIREEMQAEGLCQQEQKKKAPARTQSRPLTIKLDDATTILVGRNNRQNDLLTFKLASSHDLWFHAHGIPGSHVILQKTGFAPSLEEIEKAAAVAAYYSKAKNETKVAVDYTPKKLVKKPSGAKPGFVIFTGQKTIMVTPRDWQA